ncbi:MFS transporter [Shimazuella sp. AN120528]|uniref:MDR family MFS transporter n=1 Tax=Shimazuella soli TaxID=1892854 RepID=UPI001F102FEC|nr:MFS transporter [Shimazuella soli]
MKEKKSGNGLLITGLIVAMLFAALDNTIVGTAMPKIVGELGGLELMTWLTTAYMLTSTAIVPIAGKLADLLGRKVVYLSGIFIFMLGSALCGIASTMDQLIFYRALQGLGGGVMMPMAMIIIGDIFTGAQRAKWQGVFGGIFALASVVGPQVGGWIVDSLNWSWVFYINLPVGLLAFIFIAMGLKSHKAEGPVKFDILGMFTMIVGVVSLLLALTFGGNEYAWGSWQIISLFVLAVVGLVAFVMVENRAEEPILPMYLFKNRTFTLLNGIGFLMSLGMFGAIMFVPLFMQGIIGISASASGTVMTPMMFSMILASILAGQLVKKIGIRIQMIIGMAVMSFGFYLLSTMTMETSKLQAMTDMVILGLGMGLIMPLLTLALQESFPKSELGVVTSSSQFFRQIGGTFGMTILGAIMNHKSSTLLTNQLVPTLDKLPPQAHGMVTHMKDLVANNPQGLYSMLLSSETMNKIPQAMQNIFVPILKGTLVDSLHLVFIVGLVFVIAGLVFAPFLKNIKISDGKEPTEEKKAS